MLASLKMTEDTQKDMGLLNSSQKNRLLVHKRRWIEPNLMGMKLKLLFSEAILPMIYLIDNLTLNTN